MGNYMELTKGRTDLNESMQEFLEKCAHASFKEQDRNSMMKYVKEFSSLESMRNFLKKRVCVDELVELELEYHNLGEAVKYSRQTGNIIWAADLLEKAGAYDACDLYLAFVFASSLWADGNRGWPLKELSPTKYLLSKAKNLASKCYPQYSYVVRKKIQLLSSEEYDLLELKEQFADLKHGNLMGEILTSRRILDKLIANDVSMYKWEVDVNRNSMHLHSEKTSNRLSLNDLIYYWNFWRAKIENIITCFENEKQAACNSEEIDFCLEYLGVRKRSINSTVDYVLLYPKADWVKYVPQKGQNSGTMESISLKQLVIAVKHYWCTEILSVGMELLNLLHSFHQFAIENFRPVCYISQNLCFIFEVAQCLLVVSRLQKWKNVGDLSLMSFIDLSAQEYFCYHVSLDWRKKRMLLLKDVLIPSYRSRDLLKESILKQLKIEVADVEGASPTLFQIIQIPVILLGSNWQTNKEYQKAAILSKIDAPWNSLIKVLLSDMGPQTPDCAVEIVWNLFNAISEANHSNPNLGRGCCYMGTSCFIYLLERLLLSVSCFKGCLFATRSAVIEWLVHLNWNVSKGIFDFNSAISPSTEPIYDFLAYTIYELLMNKHGTEERMKEDGLDLIQKLLVLMCLVCLNSGKYFELLYDVERSYLISLLPTSFVDASFCEMSSSFHGVLAEALNRIEDPLVIIRNPDVYPFVDARNAIFLKAFYSNQDTMIDKLFSTY